jgi:hypothetical protein
MFTGPMPRLLVMVVPAFRFFPPAVWLVNTAVGPIR